jgi:pimeloyl-ACP methyl ester carboxylesterase
MRLTLTSTLAAAALAFPQLAPSYARAQPAPAPSASVDAIHDGKAEVNGILYHYLLAKGRGDPVVLLHGWGSTSYMWRYVMPQLVARGYTVLAPDLRGLGDTTKPAMGYDKATVAGDIRALVAKLGLGTRVNIVGHDLGGMVAYAYAAQNPDEVRPWRSSTFRCQASSPGTRLQDPHAPGISGFSMSATSPRC